MKNYPGGKTLSYWRVYTDIGIYDLIFKWLKINEISDQECIYMYANTHVYNSAPQA